MDIILLFARKETACNNSFSKSNTVDNAKNKDNEKQLRIGLLQKILMSKVFY